MDIGIRGACVAGDRLWFVLTKGNGLCSMDLDTGEAKYMTHIPEEDMSGTFLYEEIRCYEQQLILVPGNAKEIAVYDMETRKILKIPVYAEHLKYKEDYDGLGKFHSTFMIGEWVYFVPCRFPSIVKMNMKTYEVFHLEGWLKDVLPYHRADRVFFRKDAVSDGNSRVYLTSLYYNMILAIDTRSDRTFIVRKGCVGDGSGCSCITYKNNRFVLSERNQQIISVFDQNWKLRNQIDLSHILYGKYWIDYIQSLVWEKYIFYIPFGATAMLRLNMDTNSLDIVKQWELKNVPKYERAWLYQDKLYCYRNLYIDVFNIEGHLTSSIRIKGQEDFENDMITELFMQGNILEETQWLKLTGLLKFLNKKIPSFVVNDYSPCGEIIYEKIVDLS